MAEPRDQVPVLRENEPITPGVDDKAEEVFMHEDAPVDEKHVYTREGEVGAAIVGQQHLIPTTGARQLTSKWEYAFYLIFVSRIEATDMLMRLELFQQRCSWVNGGSNAHLSNRWKWWCPPSGSAQSPVPQWHGPLGRRVYSG